MTRTNDPGLACGRKYMRHALVCRKCETLCGCCESSAKALEWWRFAPSQRGEHPPLSPDGAPRRCGNRCPQSGCALSRMGRPTIGCRPSGSGKADDRFCQPGKEPQCPETDIFPKAACPRLSDFASAPKIHPKTRDAVKKRSNPAHQVYCGSMFRLAKYALA